MNENQLQNMQGQVEALSLALSSLMANLRPMEAEQTVKGLRNALDYEQSLDKERNTPQSAIEARDAVAEGYCALLSTIAQSDR